MEHILNRRTATILTCTRTHKPGTTPCGLAYAVHFAISDINSDNARILAHFRIPALT